MRHAGDIIIVIQRRVQAGRCLKQVSDHLAFFIAAHVTFFHRQMRSESGQHRELAGERLGRCNADLGSGMGGKEKIGLARHGTGRHVDHHADGLPGLFAVAQRCERIRRFARLRNEQRQPPIFQHRLAVAEFARDIDVDRHTGELFEPVFCDHPGVIRCSAGDDCDAFDGG